MGTAPGHHQRLAGSRRADHAGVPPARRRGRSGMRDEEHHVHDLVAAYMLGAVTPDEASLVEEHLATCAACRRLEGELRAVVALLPVAAGDMTPPPDLKARVMAAVRAEAQGGAGTLTGPAAPRAPRDGLRPTADREAGRAPGARRPGAWRATLVALAAVIAVVVVGVGVWRLSGGGQPRPTREYAVRGTAVQTAITGSLLYFKDGTRL